MTCSNVLAMVVGYSFAVFVGPLLEPVLAALWKTTLPDEVEHLANQKKLRKQHRKALVTLGMIERLLWAVSIQMGKPEFIAVWFALKVVGVWKMWSEEMA